MWSSIARLSPVCPPTVGNTASGRSRAMTWVANSSVSGSTYVASAISGSVMIVAGLELRSTTRYPSFFRALHAWQPE